MAGQIFFVCGHAHWGKSLSLRPLTGGTHQGRWASIAGLRIRVMKMSNDDRPVDEYARDIEGLLVGHSLLIVTLCPAFDKPGADPSAFLQRLLARGYSLHFWVLERQYGGTKTISEEQIARLEKFGDVEVFRRKAEGEERAKDLSRFIADRLKPAAPS